ncbi:ORF1283 [White spot syndrome virus]|uniref:Wsv524 n=3 Tax=White spot syndrome virus TaxID=342409 RepID=Q8VAA2_WSSVS|nr:wsv524 [Shrimp white spot syndrome virus]AFX59885.1 wsv524 [White spot syndrome virus]AAL33525.1 wsv524 [Shrimp white spot syndrome virus]AAL88917.1 WSSV049 [Shrimp white spot syndrome virus]ATU84042.1 ORF1283 [White spot syndrome virus]AWQ61057.1 wsv524 [Shrimp white spot syndrome virus]
MINTSYKGQFTISIDTFVTKFIHVIQWSKKSFISIIPHSTCSGRKGQTSNSVFYFTNTHTSYRFLSKP